MWRRCAVLVLAMIGCVSARSDDAKSAVPASQVATQPAAPVERVALLPTEPRRAAELETTFPDDTIVRIGDGAERAVGVYRDAIGGKSRGVVIVVLGSASAADADDDSTRLRRALPREHWATLAVTLPDLPNEMLPPRQHDKFVAGAPAPAQPPAAQSAATYVPPADPMPARVKARLDAAIKAAREKGTNVIALGGASAGAWIAWAQNNGLGADAIVAIDIARGSPTIDGKRPKESLAAITTPTLLLMETPFEWSVDDALGPQVDLRHLPAGDPAGRRLERRISGWLQRRFDKHE